MSVYRKGITVLLLGSAESSVVCSSVPVTTKGDAGGKSAIFGLNNALVMSLLTVGVTTGCTVWAVRNLINVSAKADGYKDVPSSEEKNIIKGDVISEDNKGDNKIKLFISEHPVYSITGVLGIVATVAVIVWVIAQALKVEDGMYLKKDKEGKYTLEEYEENKCVKTCELNDFKQKGIFCCFTTKSDKDSGDKKWLVKLDEKNKIVGEFEKVKFLKKKKVEIVEEEKKIEVEKDKKEVKKGKGKESNKEDNYVLQEYDKNLELVENSLEQVEKIKRIDGKYHRYCFITDRNGKNKRCIALGKKGEIVKEYQCMREYVEKIGSNKYILTNVRSDNVEEQLISVIENERNEYVFKDSSKKERRVILNKEGRIVGNFEENREYLIKEKEGRYILKRYKNLKDVGCVDVSNVKKYDGAHCSYHFFTDGENERCVTLDKNGKVIKEFQIGGGEYLTRFKDNNNNYRLVLIKCEKGGVVEQQLNDVRDDEHYYFFTDSSSNKKRCVVLDNERKVTEEYEAADEKDKKLMAFKEDGKTFVARSELFRAVTGVDERTFRNDINGKIGKDNKIGECIEKDEDGVFWIKNLATGEKTCAGKFEMLSIGEMEDKINKMSEAAFPGGGTFNAISINAEYGSATHEQRKNIEVGNMQSLKENVDAAFAVASNFNALETLSPNDEVSEKFIGAYLCDETQGPFSVLSAMPGVIWRTYGIFHDENENPENWRQTNEKQINFLEDLGIETKNGYIVENIDSLYKKIVEDPEAYKKYKIGYHSRLQVCGGYCKNKYKQELIKDAQYVDQMFSAAFCFLHFLGRIKDYNAFGKDVLSKVEKIAKKLIEFCIKAQLMAAFVKGKKKVVITLIGLGAFGNKAEWFVEILKSDWFLSFIEESGMQVTLNLFDSEAKEEFKSLCTEVKKLVSKSGGTYRIFLPDGKYCDLCKPEESNNSGNNSMHSNVKDAHNKNHNNGNSLNNSSVLLNNNFS